MLQNYLMVAMRNLGRHKVYSTINVLGLALGMACAVPVILLVQEELSYDKHFRNADRIHRVVLRYEGMSPEGWRCGARTMPREGKG